MLDGWRDRGSLVEKKVPYIVGRASYTANARGQIIGDNEGFLKLLFRASDMKLLGVHVIGEQARPNWSMSA